ncbi:DUF1657 domain-containing protein [Ornithinibacillus halophilus]|uniref:DUF1657 domain-containing protein n=1 Tax=Ornithinibacillus halophilus TaxID=930117 RepID=A0A1M5I9I5_9BACI|nr:DUF1657 domain-containing protein [Ornithinibacillus halophilus]SHG24912.1 Protein of unknown function [Ornithinibacillus halophilus]
MTVGSQVKSCYASIKGIEATLSTLASQTNEKEAREVFRNAETIIAEIKEDMEKQVIWLSQEEPQYKQ